MIPLYTVFTFGILHWLFDFKFQSGKMATQKSHCAKALCSHVCVYSIGLVLMAILNHSYFASFDGIVLWVTTNSAFHLMTDYFTSKLSSALYKENDMHNFFATIGVDQFIHNITLFGTFVYFAEL